MRSPAPRHFSGTEEEVFGPQGFPLAVHRRDPQITYPRHSHDFTELVIVTGGHGLHQAEGENWPLTRGDVLLIRRGAAHAYARSHDLRLININFEQKALKLPMAELRTVALLKSLFADSEESGWGFRLRLNAEAYERVSSLARRLEGELKQKAPGFRMVGPALLVELLIELARSVDANPSPGPVAPNAIVRRTLALIEEHPEVALPTKQLARQVGTSPRTLQRCFRAALSLSPQQYRIQVRLQQACRLLREGDATVTEIAYRLGFGDSNYFTRLFRQRIGLSPTRYRRQAHDGHPFEPS